MQPIEKLSWLLVSIWNGDITDVGLMNLVHIIIF